MPFGNSGVDFEMDGALPRLVFAKPRPLGNGTADSSGATAWSFARREVSAGPLQKAFSQLLLLAWGEQITAQCQGQPQRSHQFERFNKAHAQHWCLPLGRVGSLSGQQGAGQDDGGDFLGAGFQGVALQDVGFAQLAFEFPSNTTRVPSVAHTIGPVRGRVRSRRIEQAGPQTQLDRTGESRGSWTRARGFRALPATGQ